MVSFNKKIESSANVGEWMKVFVVKSTFSGNFPFTVHIFIFAVIQNLKNEKNNPYSGINFAGYSCIEQLWFEQEDGLPDE